MKNIRYISAKQKKTENLRVAIYCRVSTKKKAQLASLSNQIMAYTELILKHPGWELAGVFWDCGKSGLRKKERIGLKRMLEGVDKGKIDYILTKSVKRVSRNTLELLQMVRYLKERGIAMYFEVENVNSMDASAEAIITLTSAVGQEESRNLSENVQWRIERKFEKGIFSSYKYFMGYRYESGELMIVPEQAEIVRLIFDLYLNGFTLTQIKIYLEEHEIRTISGKTVWSANVIQQMLKNEKYKGDSVLQKTYTEDYLNGIRRKNVGQRPKYYVTGSHPAIILPELFDKVQEEMFRRARLVTDEKGNSLNSGNRYSSKYLLSNLLVCGNCGAGFRRRTERGKIVWRCGRRMEEGKDACRHSPTLQDQQIVDILNEIVCNGNYDENIVREKVKWIDVYEKQVIICFAKTDKYEACELD